MGIPPNLHLEKNSNGKNCLACIHHVEVTIPAIDCAKFEAHTRWNYTCDAWEWDRASKVWPD